MAIFKYEAMNAAGQEVKAEVEAATREEAAAKIKTQGCYPTRIKERAAKKAREDVGGNPGAGGAGGNIGGTPMPRRRFAFRNFAFGRISTRALAEFTQQLSILQDAGLPIVRSLKILEQQERTGLLKQTLAEVAGNVEDGTTLSEAMARHPRVFDRLYVNMVQAGETGGVLDVILPRLAEFMEKAQRLRRRVIGAMIYPAVVISFSLLIVMGIMMFVVPKFQEIFKDFRTDLPWLTVALISTADVIAHRFGWAIILGLPLGVWLMLNLLGKNAAGRRALDTTKLRLPIVGRIVRKTAVARFSRTLGTLLGAGVPILDALIITRDTVGNVVFAGALKKVHDAVREGESFATPLRAARVCDPIVTNMVDVGEETGDLDKMLLKIADNYDDQVDVLVGSLVSLLEPMMVIGLGGIVGTIVLALFMPLAQMLKKMTEPGGT